MADLHETYTLPERTYLVGLELYSKPAMLSIEDSLDELALLAETAGLAVIGQTYQRLHAVDSATYIGAGKVEEIKALVQAHNVQLILFDDELSPRHQRELEKRFGDSVRVLDRSALILDIFAQHARTHEGALQVELAQYEYRLPRLTRQWTHLARQGGGGGARGGNGGVGLRGPGETQLEVDRREISARISKLKRDLEAVRTHRETHRRKRRNSGVPLVALVGYTNAGKSTLLKALTGADTYIANQLFATLDPLTRKATLPSGRQVLFSDTVGFIHKLPTTLIAAFRATLEEISEADLLLHVVDVSHPNVLEHIETVEKTLAEINVPKVRRVLVWNKADLLQGDLPNPQGMTLPKVQVLVSAMKHEGLEDLLEALETTLKDAMYSIRLKIPYAEGEFVSMLYNLGVVEQREDTVDGICITARVSEILYPEVVRFQQI